MTAAAAGLFAQHLRYIYGGAAALHLGASFGPLPAQGALVSTAAGARALPALSALERTLIYF